VAVALASAVVLVATVGAWGGSDRTAAAARVYLAKCAKIGAGHARPAALPARFPLPAGTAIGAYGSPRGRELVLTGAVPGDLQRAAAFMRSALTERGYAVGAGDSEFGEAEAPFSKGALRGKWKLNAIVACPAMKLTLVLLRDR